jgi:glycine betaine/proline transport system substrate-binding protein
MVRLGLSHWTSQVGSRLAPEVGEKPYKKRRARSSAAIAAGVCAMLLVTACAQTATTESAEGVNSEVAAALKQEGEVVFMSSEGQMENALQAYLMVDVIQRLGGEASLQPITDYTVMATAMSKADNMIVMDFWRWQAPDIWDKYVEQEKTIIEVGTSDYQGEEGWYVPTYVIKGDPERGIEPMCSGLPDWKALNGCADVFATSKTQPKGQYMEGAEAWAPFYGDQERIDNLKLNYEMVFAGSEPALFAELQRAYQRGEPWLGLMWRPNYMTQIMDLTRVEFPPYTDECWGTTYACQWPETVIYQLASDDVPQKYPTVWNILQNYEMPDERLAQMQKYMIEDGMSYADATKKWADENEEVWQAWAQQP